MNKSFKFFVALYIAKLGRIALKLLRRNATFYPGKVAIKICPDFLGRIGKPETIIGVTGTNGKTTVSNMIIDILEDNGYKPVTNRLGANVNAGIATSLIADANLFGNSKSKLAVFEIDERSSIRIYPYITPTYVVCTNLFRDSIKRNAHTEYIQGIINSSMPKETKLILNADDLICSGVGSEENEKIYFGIDKLPTDVKECINIIQDIRTCPVCDEALEYDYLRYHHIGKAHCTKCDFKSPEADYLVTSIDKDNLTMEVSAKGEKDTYKLSANGIINIYNTVAAITLLSEFGLSKEQITNSLNNSKVVKSRFSNENIGGIDVIMHLAKGQNPVACSRVFDYIKNESGNKAVILNLDDYFDARETSENLTWIYDTDYELLNDESIKQIVIGGVRCEDHLLRLLLAGVPREKISYTRNEIDTVELLNLEGIDKVFITYDVYTVHTANAVKQKLLKKIKKEEE